MVYTACSLFSGDELAGLREGILTLHRPEDPADADDNLDLNAWADDLDLFPSFFSESRLHRLRNLISSLEMDDELSSFGSRDDDEWLSDHASEMDPLEVSDHPSHSHAHLHSRHSHPAPHAHGLQDHHHGNHSHLSHHQHVQHSSQHAEQLHQPLQTRPDSPCMTRPLSPIDSTAAEDAILAAERNKDMSLPAALDYTKKQANNMVLLKDFYSIVSPRQEEKYAQLFASLDTHGHGVIGLEDLVEHISQNASDDESNLLMHIFDLNGDGYIERDEYVVVSVLRDKVMNSHRSLSSLESQETRFQRLLRLYAEIEKLKKLYAVMDPEGTGLISADSLCVLLAAAMGKSKIVDRIVHRLTREKDGNVTLAEFLAYIPFFGNLHKRIVASSPITQACDPVAPVRRDPAPDDSL
eukprot:m.175368 g.175368  ORF g.175368 m.175368 type:complete len:410 (+) comp21353_c1_seq1:258-1487(+)